MTALPRRVIVDDTDPQIQYSIDQWTLQIGETISGPGIVPSGPPFQNTTHLSNSTSSLSLQFQGSSPQVFGASTANADSFYECFIDGTSIGSTTAIQTFFGNNELLCDGTSFVEEKEYTLMLNISHAGGRLVWFDYVTYIPSTSVPLGSATALVDRLDPAIVYSAGPGEWGIDSLGSFTQSNGSSVTFNFTGTSVSWVGFTPKIPLRQPSSNAVYSIDRADPVAFRLDGLRFSDNLTNQVFFTSPVLSPGPHSLEVTYQGNSTAPPLTLSYLVVANLNVSTTSASPQPPVTSLPATSSANKPRMSAPIGAIIGGVIGGVAVLCLAAFLLQRRNRQRKISHKRFGTDHDGTATPSHLIPFDAAPSWPAVAKARNRTAKAHRSLIVDPPGLNPFTFLDRPSGPDNPDATPRAQLPNQQALSLHTPRAEVVHEPDRGPRSITSDEAADPPPSYAS
ncbi:hypothetical protein BD779DRAFT_1473968 [Infundibulicybe gibba]|nr:hypothetical protein BD779DRAFT_1473968 [Infundibulicybe gibba]